MHLYAFKHKVHSVDTLHSDALAFLRIQAHEDAFTHTRIQGECGPPKGLAQLQDACMLTRVCILTHSYAFSHTLTHSSAFRCINSHTQSGRVQTSQGAGSAPRLVHAHSCMHSDAFVCIRMHSYVFICIRIHSYAFVCILMPAACSGRSSPAWKPSWCTRTGSQTWSRSP